MLLHLQHLAGTLIQSDLKKLLCRFYLNHNHAHALSQEESVIIFC